MTLAKLNAKEESSEIKIVTIPAFLISTEFQQWSPKKLSLTKPQEPSLKEEVEKRIGSAKAMFFF